MEHELASSARLTVLSRRGGQRLTLDKETGRALRKEAVEIIGAVRDWTAESGILSALREALEPGEALSGSISTEKLDVQVARRLRFPLLTGSELKRALDRKNSPEELAFKWIKDRLATDVAPTTLEKRLR